MQSNVGMQYIADGRLDSERGGQRSGSRHVNIFLIPLDGGHVGRV